MGKRRYDRIIGLLTMVNCSGTHYKKLGYTDMMADIGEPIIYIDEKENKVDTGEKVHMTDYDAFNPDATIVNNKYVLIWI